MRVPDTRGCEVSVATAPVASPLKWHDIPGFPGYRVDEGGGVWSCWKSTGRPEYTQKMCNEWKRLKPQPRPEDGRKRYTLKDAEGNYRRIYASHLVLIAFVGPCPEGMEACHNNGVCTDDSRTNLRWDTPVANKADMLAHGTRLMGENHPKTKLSDDDIRQVIEIRRRGERLKVIAGMFNVTEQRVHQICKKGGR